MNTRVLVVEDDLIQQQVLERFLTSHGYHVATAGTGMEAIKRMRDDRFDVIILDYAMPGFDGVDAARWIRRETDGFTRPRLIALSANTQGMLDNEAGADAVFDHIEQKPWNPKTLIGIMRTFEVAPRSGPQFGNVEPARGEASGSDDEDDRPLLRVTTGTEKVRVLIVDEDESVRSTFRASLEKADYTVSLAGSRAEAIGLLAGDTFDIVFADYFGSAKFCGTPSAFLKQADQHRP